MHATMRARGVGMGKTPQGMNADLQRSANVFPNTPANVKEWSKPGGSRRMDIEGIDTKPTMMSDDAPTIVNGRIIFKPTARQEAKWDDKTPEMPSDEYFKDQWKKTHRGKVTGWGLGKRQWLVNSWGMTRDYQVGMWQGRVDKANGLDYNKERKDKAYNYGYNLGYTEYESNRRGWDDKTRGTFDKKYTKGGTTINREGGNSDIGQQPKETKKDMIIEDTPKKIVYNVKGANLALNDDRDKLIKFAKSMGYKNPEIENIEVDLLKDGDVVTINKLVGGYQDDDGITHGGEMKEITGIYEKGGGWTGSVVTKGGKHIQSIGRVVGRGYGNPRVEGKSAPRVVN